jgi:hypothetical protein
MVAFIDISKGKTPAEASDIQQIIDALSARRNTPIAITIADPLAYALTIKNTDPGARGIILYAADGTTVLFQIDAAGVKVSRDGTAAVSPVTSIGSGAAPTAAAGDHVHGAGGYSSTGTTTLEALFAASWTSTAVNYTVAAGILYVFCTAGVTVTLPAVATTNRPITVIAITGSTTVAAAGGTVNGGSVNTTTGAVMNGVVSQGDSVTYKSNGTNWYAI